MVDPLQLAVDANKNLFVTDGSSIKMYSPGENGPFILDGTYDYTMGVTAGIDGSTYVTDKYQGQVYKVTSTGTVTMIAGWAALNAVPSRLAVDHHNNLYIATTNPYRIKKLTPGSQQAVDFAVSMKQAVAVDTAGNVYGIDLNTHVLQKISPDGVKTPIAEDHPFHFTAGIAVDTQGNIYLTDNDTDSIFKITLD